MKATVYPSREEATQYRREIEETVAAVRSGEEPTTDALTWPAGLDRTILRGLPLTTHTRNCLVRTRLMEGTNALTVAEMGRTPEVGPTTVRNLLLGVDEFLRDYVETFEGRPEPADVAAWRLRRALERLTSTEWAIVEQRMLRRPPVEFYTMSVELGMSTARIRTRLTDAKWAIQIALAHERRSIAERLRSELGPCPAERDLKDRIDGWLDELLPHDGDWERTRRVFRHALLEEMRLQATTRQG